MTNNEAAKWIQLYIDIAKIDPTTGEAAYLNDDNKKTIEAMEMAINALTNERTETHACDSISRQAAIDTSLEFFVEFLGGALHENAQKELIARIQRLPSAQPELAQDLRNACTDAISRQAAIDAMANTLWHYPNECYRNLSKYEFAKGLAELGLKSVPPAQPEQFVKGCRNCKYGKYNDFWKTHFCYNPNECTEWNLWEPNAQPEPIRINLNETIKVKLTDLGKEIYYHQYDRINQIAGREICKPKFPKEDENGYTEFQLWCFIELYGMHIGMTLPNVIEPLEIVYERKRNDE